MSEPKKMLATLPFFPGFYESLLSGAVDSYEEWESEWMAEKECSQKYEPETYQPEHLRLSASEYVELFFKCTDYQKTYLKVAQFWVEAFDEWCKENLKTPAKSFTWESMKSPREYNFETDRVFVHVPEEVVKMLFTRSEEQNHQQLRETIKELFTSRSGFMSFYSNDLEAWLEKPLETWDHNEVMTLIMASIIDCDEFEDRGKFEMALYELVFSGNGEEEEAMATDWEKFERLKTELRASKAEAAQTKGN